MIGGHPQTPVTVGASGPAGTGPAVTAARSAARVRRVQAFGPPAILLLLCIGFAVSTTGFLAASNLRTIIDQAAIPLVLAVGLTFVVLQGSIDLSLEGVMAISSIALSLLIANNYNGSDLGAVAVMVVLALATSFGLLNGVLYTMLRIPSLLVTLGTWFVGLGAATLLYPARQPRILDDSFKQLALGRWLDQSRLVYVALVVLAVGFLLERYTRFGRVSFAIGGGEETARLSGLNLRRVKVLAFAFAGFCAGVAALMASARSGVGSVEAGEGRLFPAISAVVIGGTLLSGGRGGVVSSLIGVLILVVLANGLVLLGVGPYVQQIVQGAIIVLAVVAAHWQLRDRMAVAK